MVHQFLILKVGCWILSGVSIQFKIIFISHSLITEYTEVLQYDKSFSVLYKIV